MQTHYTLMDIGVWILSDRAVKALFKKAPVEADGKLAKAYDLYSEFGCALGEHPSQPDAELADLSVAILPLPGGEFYHFGTTPELLTSTESIQNRVKDQRFIIQKSVKRHSSVFTQNLSIVNKATEKNEYVWMENSYLGADFHFTTRNVITGIPKNDWNITLEDGVCVDIVPIGEDAYALRPYGYTDAFRGSAEDENVTFLEKPWKQWLEARGIDKEQMG